MKNILSGFDANQDEIERRALQEYIFNLEEAQEKALQLSLEHEKLTNSQKLLMAILTAAPNGISLVKDRKLAWCNQGFTDIFGWSRQELVGKSVEVLYPSRDEYNRVGNVVYDKSPQSRLGTYEYDFVHKDGFRVPCIVTGRALDEKDISRGYIFTFTNITERKKAETALRESERKFRLLVDNIPAVVFTIYPNWSVAFVDNKIEKLTGYSKEEFDSKRINWSDLILEEDLENAKIEFDSLETTSSICEYRIKHKKGNILWIQSRSQLICDENEKAKYASCVIVDISERKRYEEELKKAKDTAEASNRAKSRFLANMSHELRTPLNHIIGFTQLVVNKHFGGLTQAQEEYLTNVLHSSDHLLSLINEILDLSKVEAGKLELTLSEVRIKHLMQNSLSMMKENALKRRIRLLMNMEDMPETIEADERKLKQVLCNLLSNAVKFTPDGGSVTLSACPLSFADGSEIAHDVSEPGFPGFNNSENMRYRKYIQFSVRDTGIGIDKEDLGRIFKPFEQVETSANRKYPGSGLGLSLTKSLIELHGGSIRAQSDGKGKGSTFSFVIPV